MPDADPNLIWDPDRSALTQTCQVRRDALQTLARDGPDFSEARIAGGAITLSGWRHSPPLRFVLRGPVSFSAAMQPSPAVQNLPMRRRTLRHGVDPSAAPENLPSGRGIFRPGMDRSVATQSLLSRQRTLRCAIEPCDGARNLPSAQRRLHRAMDASVSLEKLTDPPRTFQFLEDSLRCPRRGSYWENQRLRTCRSFRKDASTQRSKLTFWASCW